MDNYRLALGSIPRFPLQFVFAQNLSTNGTSGIVIKSCPGRLETWRKTNIQNILHFHGFGTVVMIAATAVAMTVF